MVNCLGVTHPQRPKFRLHLAWVLEQLKINIAKHLYAIPRCSSIVSDLNQYVMNNYQIFTRKDRSAAKSKAKFGRKNLIISATSKREALNQAASMLPNEWLSASELVEGDTSKR